MRRNHLVAVGVFAALLIAGGVWWINRRDEQPPAPELPPPESPIKAETDPPRPPELFGIVEEASPLHGGGTRFLVRSTQPKLPGWDSPQNAHHRQIEMTCYVLVREGVRIRDRNGAPVEVAVGQTVSAWCSGPMYTTLPPGWFADAVVIESADR